jgi:diadenylate cyclase
VGVVIYILLLVSEEDVVKVTVMAVGLALLYVLTGLAHLSISHWIFGKALSYFPLVLLFAYWIELRRGLKRLFPVGKERKSLDWAFKKYGFSTEVERSLEILSENRIGALIVFEREESLDEQISTGVPLDAIFTADLIATIFSKNSPMHDGAVIVRNKKVVAAGCTLPYSDRLEFDSDLGMRHKAGVGISERSDAVAIIVSEEKGAVSLAVDGQLAFNVEPKVVVKTLGDLGVLK